MQKKAGRLVRIDIEMVDSLRVKGTGTPDDAVHFVPLAEKEFGEVRAVLAGDTGYERFFHFCPFFTI